LSASWPSPIFSVLLVCAVLVLAVLVCGPRELMPEAAPVGGSQDRRAHRVVDPGVAVSEQAATSAGGRVATEARDATLMPTVRCLRPSALMGGTTSSSLDGYAWQHGIP
jgi:hypothetical protein